MAWLTLAGMIVIPLIVAGIWLVPELPANVSLQIARREVTFASLDSVQRILALAVALIPAAIQVAALWFLRRVFLEGAAGRWFSLAAVRSFRRFAWVSLILVPIEVAQESAMSIITTMRLPEGERTLTVSFGSENFGALFTALIMLFVAHMFAAGREVDEENAAFI